MLLVWRCEAATATVVVVAATRALLRRIWLGLLTFRNADTARRAEAETREKELAGLLREEAAAKAKLEGGDVAFIQSVLDWQA